jgi:hypothetical protein
MKQSPSPQHHSPAVKREAEEVWAAEMVMRLCQDHLKGMPL